VITQQWSNEGKEIEKPSRSPVHAGLLKSTHANGIVHKKKEKNKTHKMLLCVQGDSS